MAAPIFYYDFNSPYSYLAAARVDGLLPEPPSWQPIAFPFVYGAHDRVPWSLSSDASREEGMRECELRAQRYGLAPMVWPPGWPAGSYTLAPLRAALAAAEQGRLREFSAAAFDRYFVAGLSLKQPDELAAVCAQSGVDAELVRERIGDPALKRRLTEATDAAVAAGVLGVPTVAVAGELFWGDDRLEDAAAAATG